MQDTLDLITTPEAASVIGVSRQKALAMLRRCPESGPHQCPWHEHNGYMWVRGVVEELAEDYRWDREEEALCPTDDEAAERLGVPVRNIATVFAAFDVQPMPRRHNKGITRRWHPRDVSRTQRELEERREQWVSTSDAARIMQYPVKRVDELLHRHDVESHVIAEVLGYGRGIVWNRKQVFKLRWELFQKMERKARVRSGEWLTSRQIGQHLGIPDTRVKWAMRNLADLHPEEGWLGLWPVDSLGILEVEVERVRDLHMLTSEVAEVLGVEHMSTTPDLFRSLGLRPVDRLTCMWKSAGNQLVWCSISVRRVAARLQDQKG